MQINTSGLVNVSMCGVTHTIHPYNIVNALCDHHNIAKVALARDLLRMIYVVLMGKRKYYSKIIRSTADVALHGV